MKNLKTTILAIALIVPLSGCAGFAETALNLPSGLLTTTIKNPAGKRELAVVENSVIIARKLALRYIRLGICTQGQLATFANPCADPNAVAIIKSADMKIRVVLPSARKFVRNNDTINAFSALAAVKEAVSDIRLAVGK